MIRKQFLILFFSLFPVLVFSQSGIKFLEFAKRLEPYYDNSLITDIKNQLPQGDDFTIWGYDVGDFSGDGNNDVAMAVRLAGDNTKNMQVYLFTDIDGFLKKVGQFDYKFLDLPLEIGVVIKRNACYITQKYMQFNWDVDGYVYDNGNISQLDKFSTRKIGNITYESSKNYLNLRAAQKYILTKNNQELFYRDYMMIPSYSRGRTIYKGIQANLFTDYVDYVNVGAFWWKGTKDCSFKISSSYDDEYLYYTINVNDDAVVIQYCDTCIADYIDVWFDVNQYIDADRFTKKNGDKIDFRNKTDKGIFRISVYPGNFLDLEPIVKVSTTNDLTSEQKFEAKNIKAISNLKAGGYIVKFRIPFSLLGIDLNIISKNKIYEIGNTIIVTDYDNEFRPEEKTEIATSVFKVGDPSTYSVLMLIPDNIWFGNSSNIFSDEILKNLLENGF
jgi:hypothetical protein